MFAILHKLEQMLEIEEHESEYKAVIEACESAPEEGEEEEEDKISERQNEILDYIDDELLYLAFKGKANGHSSSIGRERFLEGRYRIQERYVMASSSRGEWINAEHDGCKELFQDVVHLPRAY